MIEGGLLGERIGVNHHKFISAMDRFPVPKVVRAGNPIALAGHINRQSLKFFAKPLRPLIIRERALRVRGGDAKSKRRKNQSRKDAADDEMICAFHVCSRKNL